MTEYQLAIEHASDAAEFDSVLFADSHPECREPFELQPLAPSDSPSRFTSHFLTPGEVLRLAFELFNRRPRSYLLAIRGYSFEPFDERLTPRAEANLLKAADFIIGKIERGEL